MKNRPIRLVLTGLVLVALGASCSSSDDASSQPASDVTTVTTSAMPSPVTDPTPLAPELPLVRLLTPLATTTELAPEFSWEPVAGAVTYRLAVLGADGPVWSWEGGATAVRIGGFTEDRPAGFPGPVIDETTTWSVVALDADGAVVATSDLRSLAPSEG